MTEKFDDAAKNVSPRDAQKGGQGALSADHPETNLQQDAKQNDAPTEQSHDIKQGLTSDEIALLCDIEARDSSKLGDREPALDRLRSAGYIIPKDDRPGYKLTVQGLNLLGRRGAGINEA
jgi:hypothetical protein